MMQSLLHSVSQFFSGERGTMVITAILILFVGWILARLLRSVLKRMISRSMSEAHANVVSRLSYTLMVAVVVLIAIRQLGADLSVLLGAAGILTVALGFASQTSASNLISGLFLLGERPFVVGDIIRIGSTTGEVVSVDLLSVKMRTFDNLFVRVPNETLLKTEITTLTRYPIRRIDLQLSFSIEHDLDAVKAALDSVTAKNPLCLEEPEPILFFERFAEGTQHVKYAVWVQQERYVEVINDLPNKLRRALHDEGIHFAIPRRSLEPSPHTTPFEVRMGSAD